MTEGDKIAFAWKRGTDLPCKASNILSADIEFKYGFYGMTWLGNSEGINGITQEKEEIHICWKSSSIGGDISYSRIGFVTGHKYSFIAKGYSDTSYTNLPQLSSISPDLITSLV